MYQTNDDFLETMRWKKTNIIVGISSDYTSPKFENLNRDPNETRRHVEEIKESIKRNGFFKIPVLIGAGGYIKDGQHRFLACKELDVPYLFIYDPSITMQDVKQINSSSKNWSRLTYIKSNAQAGFVSYKYIESLYKEFNTHIGKQVCFDLDNIGMALFNQAKFPRSKKVEDGLLIVTEAQYLSARQKLLYAQDIIDYYREHGLKFRGTPKTLINAILFLCSNPLVNNEVLADIIKHSFQDCQNWNSIGTCLDSIHLEYRKRAKRNNNKLKAFSAMFEEDQDRHTTVHYVENIYQQEMAGDMKND